MAAATFLEPASPAASLSYTMATLRPLKHDKRVGVLCSPPVRVIALKPWLRATAISFSPAHSNVHLDLSDLIQTSYGIINPAVSLLGRDSIFGFKSG